MDSNSFTVNYHFILPDDTMADFNLEIDKKNVTLKNVNAGELPDWTKLSYRQCSNCPLTEATHPNCPAASALYPLLARFNNLLSYEEVVVEVNMEARTVACKTTAQQAISSLMGLILAVSGCPRTEYFKPMARYHLPFSEHHETFYRVASMYYMSQKYVCESGGEPDWELKGLSDIYEQLQLVNRSMAERIRPYIDQDASVNALVLLDIFAVTLPMKFSNMLEETKYLFSAYQPKSSPR